MHADGLYGLFCTLIHQKCASLSSTNLKPDGSADLSSAYVSKTQSKHTIKTAIRGKAGSPLGQAGFEGSEREMLKHDFLWQPLCVDTVSLGQLVCLKQYSLKGLSAWCWRTLLSEKPWGQEKRKVNNANNPLMLMLLINRMSSWLWDAPTVWSINTIILGVYMLSSFLTGKQVRAYTTCTCSSEDEILLITLSEESDLIFSEQI